MQTMKDSFDLVALCEAVERFSQGNVLVIGDIILDRYVWGEVNRISPEAPVPVVEVTKETRVLGGAANVAQNLATLGAKPVLCGVVGNDNIGLELMDLIEGMGLITEGIVVESSRPTTVKTRVIAHNQQVVRFDRESTEKIGEKTLEKIQECIEKWSKDSSVVLISDYGKGVICQPLMDSLRDSRPRFPGIITIDPKIGNFDLYKGADVITPNHHEAGYFCQFIIHDQETLKKAGWKMLQDLHCRSVIITQGKDGMTIFEQDGTMTHIPTMAKQVFDVTGAGDTVIGTLSLGLSIGLDLKPSAMLANFAAGIVVGHVGTYPVHKEELIKAIKDLSKK